MVAATNVDLLGAEILPNPSQVGIGGHQSPRSKNDEWLTPPHILQALGQFDLDPCAPAVRPWDMAHQHYSLIDNGLSRPWCGRVWLNPPYGPEVGRWLDRLADHGRGTALVFARTETEWFSRVWREATALLFLAGRLTFFTVGGAPAPYNGGAPSVLCAFGEADARALRASKLPGAFVALRGALAGPVEIIE